MIALSFLFPILLLQCSSPASTTPEADQPQRGNPEVVSMDTYLEEKGLNYDSLSVATFAGGCFWCTEASFEQIRGVADVISGYSGGERKHPTYQEVSSGQTRHAEAIQVFYDSSEISYSTLLDIFFTAHDPTQLNRQGPDVGPQYRSAIFYHSERQKNLAEEKMAELEATEKFEDAIVTELNSYEEFWVAEAYHQDYYPAHPNNPYIQRVSKPKVEKVKKEFSDLLKE